jgi:hypothetical protein
MAPPARLEHITLASCAKITWDCLIPSKQPQPYAVSTNQTGPLSQGQCRRVGRRLGGASVEPENYHSARPQNLGREDRQNCRSPKTGWRR